MNPEILKLAKECGWSLEGLHKPIEQKLEAFYNAAFNAGIEASEAKLYRLAKALNLTIDFDQQIVSAYNEVGREIRIPWGDEDECKTDAGDRAGEVDEMRIMWTIRYTDGSVKRVWIETK